MPGEFVGEDQQAAREEPGGAVGVPAGTPSGHHARPARPGLPGWPSSRVRAGRSRRRSPRGRGRRGRTGRRSRLRGSAARGRTRPRRRRWRETRRLPPRRGFRAANDATRPRRRRSSRRSSRRRGRPKAARWPRRARASSSPTVEPSSISCTPGRATAPESVTSAVPGASTVPASRNQRGPNRAIERKLGECLGVLHECRPVVEAALERERRLERRLGRTSGHGLQQRRLLAGDEPVGHGGDAERHAVEAPLSPLGDGRLDRVRVRRSAASEIATTAVRAPRAAAASTAPSSTRWGLCRSSALSFTLAGSPSAAFTTTIGRPGCAATAASFVPVGNPAPPRPRSPLASTSAIRSLARRGRPETAQVRVERDGAIVGVQLEEQPRQPAGNRRR